MVVTWSVLCTCLYSAELLPPWTNRCYIDVRFNYTPIPDVEESASPAPEPHDHGHNDDLLCCDPVNGSHPGTRVQRYVEEDGLEHLVIEAD